MSDILSLAKDHVKSIFQDPNWDPFTFHSVEHTWSVYENACEWANEYDLNSTDSIAIKLAALFHDVGYLSNYQNHESEGIRIFGVFADNHDLDSEVKKTVRTLIDFTRKTHSDHSGLFACIMHDIDRSAMGMQDFIEQGLNLRKEWEHFKGLRTTDKDWFEFQIQYLEKTNFKTDYGLSRYSAQKEKNLHALQLLLNEHSQ